MPPENIPKERIVFLSVENVPTTVEGFFGKITGLPSIIYIKLYNCNIKSIDSLYKVVSNTKVLDLSGNLITSIQPLRRLQSNINDGLIIKLLYNYTQDYKFVIETFSKNPQCFRKIKSPKGLDKLTRSWEKVPKYPLDIDLRKDDFPFKNIDDYDIKKF